MTNCVNINKRNTNDVTVANCGNGSCVDTDGAYNCIRNLGYEFDGITCVDINECDLDSNICGVDIFGGVFTSSESAVLGDCVNTDGSYDCNCYPGTDSVPGAADATVNNGLYHTN